MREGGVDRNSQRREQKSASASWQAAIRGGPVALACAVALLVVCGPARATPAWLAELDLSATGQTTEFQQVAVDPHGDGTAVERDDTSSLPPPNAAVRDRQIEQ